MKKILLAAVAALAIVGCTQNEEIEKAGEKAEINFGTVVKNSTRAAITDDAVLKKSGFTVYAYNTGTKKMADIAAKGLDTPFMSKVAATHDEVKGWELANGPYYWPFSDKVQIFAYATVEGAEYKLNDADIYPTITYSVKSNASEQVDFVVAKLIDQEKSDVAVNLSFSHALTQVNFSAKGSSDDFTYTITSLTIGGIAGSGTYSFAGNEWIVGSDLTATYTYPITKDIQVSGTTVKDLKLEDGALMLIPQDMTADTKVVVSYNVFSGGVKINEVADEVPLAGTTNWKAATKIRYTLTLSKEGAKVSFTPQIGPWAENDTPVAPTTPTE
jgi:putative uncharacterized protein (fragment)